CPDGEGRRHRLRRRRRPGAAARAGERHHRHRQGRTPSGERADNAVVYPDGRVDRVSTYRIDTRNTHGTGCSLSSALATRMGLGEDAGTALRWSTRWLHEAIENGEKLQVGDGTGFGPVDHSHRSR